MTTKTGKKWLQDSNGKWHDCPKSTNKYTGKQSKGFEKWVKRIPLTDKDHLFCDMCDRFLLSPETHEKYPLYTFVSTEDHNDMFHPNGEILDNIDFIVISDEEKEKLRIKRNQPKRTVKYIAKGKRVT